MERIFHRYEYWECYKNGFFASCSGQEKKNKILKVVELFSDQKNTYKYMKLVIDTWKNSCEHNLTNNSLNRIAWLGQSACVVFASVPYSVTMEAWHQVSKENRDKADTIAKELIEKWETNHLTKKQTCLRFI